MEDEGKTDHSPLSLSSLRSRIPHFLTLTIIIIFVILSLTSMGEKALSSLTHTGAFPRTTYLEALHAQT